MVRTVPAECTGLRLREPFFPTNELHIAWPIASYVFLASGFVQIFKVLGHRWGDLSPSIGLSVLPKSAVWEIIREPNIAKIGNIQMRYINHLSTPAV
jgi:hypothetical protein